MNTSKPNMISNSRQPMAITGSQASVLTNNADKPAHTFRFMDYFSIGILMP